MPRIAHRLAHHLGINRGKLAFARDDAGWLWMAQVCRDCGAVSHKAPLLHLTKIGNNPGAPIEPDDAAFTTVAVLPETSRSG